MATMKARIAVLQSMGFDNSYFTRKRTNYPATISPRCSQCEVLVIQGVACHETGCPNAKHECHGCNELIPVNHKYCEECS